MKKAPLVPLIVTGLLVVLAFYWTDWLVQEQAEKSRQLREHLQQVRISWLKLKRQISSEMSYLHADYGESEGLVRQLREELRTLETLLPEDISTEEQEQLSVLADDLEQASELIQRYHTLHAIIKNSTQQLPRLLARYLTRHPHDGGMQDIHDGRDRAYLALLSQAVSEVVLSSISLDLDLAPSLEHLIDALENTALPVAEDRLFNGLFVRHLQIIYQNMPGFLLARENLEAMPFERHLDRLEQTLNQSHEEKLRRVTQLHLILALIFLLMLVYAGWLLLRMREENRRLEGAREALDLAVVSDNLTGLPNRLAWNQNPPQDGMLILLNIDQFKHINDFYGSEAGDEILKQLARLLTINLDAELNNCIYRVGGDDFAVAVPPAWPEPPTEIAKRLLSRIEQQAFDYQGRPVRVSVSIGISQHPPLLETADLALKAVKHQRSRIKLYDPDENLAKAVEYNLQMVDEIRKALKEKRVCTWFQPLLNNRTGRVDRYECLIRIQQPDGSILNPGQFLPVAQEARLMGPLTCAMFEYALPYMQRAKQGFSINLSTSDMLDSQVVDLLQSTLESQPQLAHRLTLEILETEEVADVEAIRHFLGQMRHLGCKLAIDDFGSGYSNLSQVLLLEVEQLKIDASLVRNLDVNERAQDTVRAILQFARAAKVESVVAEHVSSATIQRMVQSLGIDYSQGFWVGKPEPELLPEELLEAETLHPAD